MYFHTKATFTGIIQLRERALIISSEIMYSACFIIKERKLKCKYDVFLNKFRHTHTLAVYC